MAGQGAEWTADEFGGSGQAKAAFRMVGFLAHPGTYPGPPSSVEVLETHMAWVFLTDRHAFKLKKPIRSSVLDYSTAEKRRANLEAELHLNRRLAPGVYLRVLPIVETEGGSLSLGEDPPGRAVDWVLQMRRLASDHTLVAAISRRTISREQAHQLAEVLIDFYRKTLRVVISAADYRERLAQQLDLSVKALSGDPDCAEVARETGSKLMEYLNCAESVPAARAPKLVDGHGDLRPEHIYFEAKPIVIDCLEFNTQLRTVDPVDELSYLAVECEMLGAGWFGDRVLDDYLRGTGDSVPPGLIRFYRGSRAMLRARLASVHATDPGRHPPEHWRRLARRYLTFAEGESAGLVERGP